MVAKPLDLSSGVPGYLVQLSRFASSDGSFACIMPLFLLQDHSVASTESWLAHLLTYAAQKDLSDIQRSCCSSLQSRPFTIAFKPGGLSLSSMSEASSLQDLMAYDQAQRASRW